MSEASLERRYRRLLAWYPQPFRAEQEEEILAVLMAGAARGQRRPRLAEAMDVIRSAVGMRLAPARSGPEKRDLADGLALFSLVAPLFLLAADALQVALPYRLPTESFLVRMFGADREIGGLSLLKVHVFDIGIGCEVIIAVLVLLGLRRLAFLAIPASFVYFGFSSWWIPWMPYPLQLLTAGVLFLEMAALLASPGPRRGRDLVNWRHAVVLLLAAGAFQGLALWYAATARAIWAQLPNPAVPVYLGTGIALTVAAAVLAVVFRFNRYFLLVFAAACYPYAMQLGFSAFHDDLLGHPTPAHLAVLFVPPVLFAAWIVFAAAIRVRVRFPAEPGRAA